MFRGGRWEPLYEVVARGDAAAVTAECRGQLEAFRDLVGRDPTHLDSHQHVHLEEPVRSVAAAMAAELGVPLRHLCPDVVHCGGFYGQTGRGEPAPEMLAADVLLRLFVETRDETAETGPAIELGCHPGWDDDLATMYCRERRTEVDVLTSPGLRERIAALGFELSTFAALAASPRGDRP